MFLNQISNHVRPAALNLPSAGCLGTVQRVAVPRDYPLEEIRLVVDFTLASNVTVDTLTAQTPAQLDAILGLVARVNLTATDPILGQRSIVDCSGRGLLEANAMNGGSVDFSTQILIAMTQTTFPAGVATKPVLLAGAYRLTYRIPLALPTIGEKLRSFCYLPVHLHKQDPILTVTFGQPSDLKGGSSGTTITTAVITQINTTVQYIRRVPNAASESAIAAGGGYLSYDFIETPYSVPVGSAAEIKFDLPLPGQYSGLIFRQYLGGANMSRNVIDATGIGDTFANGAGAEQRWRLESALNVIREWTWPTLQGVNDESRPLSALITNPGVTITASTLASQTLANGGLVEGAIMPGTNKRPASLTKIDFLSAGLTAETGVELGSLLDCDTPNANGRKMQIIGNPASVATNASFLNIVGHRFIDPTGKQLGLWQKFFA